MTQPNNIDFGTRTAWIGLYKEQAAALDDIQRASDISESMLAGYEGDLRAELHRSIAFLTNKPPEMTGGAEDDKAFADFLQQQGNFLQAARDNLENIGITASVEGLDVHNAREAAEARYQTARQALDTRTLALGRQFTGRPPAYIEQVIGPAYPEPLEEGWLTVRGAIEAYRFVTGVKRPNITLGRKPKAPWAAEAYHHIVEDIQHVQVLQMALCRDPVAVAAALGRSETILDVGLPPAPNDENLTWKGGTWLEAALAHIQATEPLAEGLLVDRRQ